MAELEIALAIIIPVVIGLVLYSVFRGRLHSIDTDLRVVKEGMSKMSESFRLVDTTRVREEFQQTLQSFGQDVVTRIDSLKRLSSEEIAKVRDDIMKLAEQRSVDAAINHIKQVSITREEFERLRETVIKMGGREEVAERLELASRVFDTTDIRVLMWQCKLLHLLEGGLAPEAETDLLIQSGIPLGSAKTFLKSLRDLEVVTLKKVESYWLNPDFTWLLTYTQEPIWLQRQLADLVIKEDEYEKYIRDHIELVEEGLLVITQQYELQSGKVDIFARDKNGIDVCLELKYPTAPGTVYGQMLKYREDLRRISGGQVRCVLVAPKISDKLKETLLANQLEFREVSF